MKLSPPALLRRALAPAPEAVTSSSATSAPGPTGVGVPCRPRLLRPAAAAAAAAAALSCMATTSAAASASMPSAWLRRAMRSARERAVAAFLAAAAKAASTWAVGSMPRPSSAATRSLQGQGRENQVRRGRKEEWPCITDSDRDRGGNRDRDGSIATCMRPGRGRMQGQGRSTPMFLPSVGPTANCRAKDCLHSLF